MTKTQKPSKQSDNVPTLISNPVVEHTYTPSEPERFVVTRDGHRVSEREYMSEEDLTAVAEWNFWKKIATKSADGTKVHIVPFDKRIHRIW